ncbi:MAG: 2-oxo acid dehydrogenase subunit E2 [Jiangellaceae bacterium]|nr:2-oxo acid dehydrogenase subunit E2 [Jiangellaceae bacterium]
MAEVSQFKLPDVGEGLTEAEIVAWKVKEGDTVKVNDVVVEIETAKSLVELPSPYAGVVDKLLVPEGATVPVGTPIIAVRTDADAADQPAAPGEPAGAGVVGGPSEDMVPAPQPREQGEDGGQQQVLVGYGPRASVSRRRARRTSADVTSGASSGTSDALTATFNAVDRSARVLAKPPVRKLAKDLGVDMTTVVPSGPDGTVTREDVQRVAAGGQPAETAVVTGAGWDGLPREERIPVRSVRKATAAAVVASAFTAPHVTEFVTIDATRTMRLIDRLRESREFGDVRLSPLAVLARAMCIAVRRTPVVNARWDEAAGEIVLQRYVNLGIAAATPRGLVVPNIKDADRLSLLDLAVAINELADKARQGTAPPSDMTGGTMSITNIGVFGVDTGTPILPPGEAAIMALGAVRRQPWVHKGKVRPRWVTTLGLSFDHRLVDGEQGSRFLSDVAAILNDPAQTLVWT